jgi:hypothetical protein
MEPWFKDNHISENQRYWNWLRLVDYKESGTQNIGRT